MMDSDAASESSLSFDDQIDSCEDNDDPIEKCCFGKGSFELPEYFCAEEEVFKEVISVTTWKNVLKSKHSGRLQRLLPVFPDEDGDDENDKSNTLKKLFDGDNFKFGNPIKTFFNRLRNGFLSSEVIEISYTLNKTNYREFQNQQQQNFLHLLQDILTSRKKLLYASHTLSPQQAVKMLQLTVKQKDTTLKDRARVRYFSTLQDLRDEIDDIESSSEDENYPGSGCFLNHPVDMIEISEERYREMLFTHRDRMMHDLGHHGRRSSKLDSMDMSGHISSKFVEEPARKRLKSDECLKSETDSEHSSTSLKILEQEDSLLIEDDVDSATVQEIRVQTDQGCCMDEVTDVKEEPEEIENRSESPCAENAKSPTSFFALLRDVLCESVEQKLSAAKLEERVRNWQDTAVATLFDWLNLHESWPDLVSSALKFLAGDLMGILPDSFVPFLDYKEKQQQWQWIGSGRDSEEELYNLCQQWLENKDDISLDILENLQGSPPPPRITTVWTVKPTNEEERKLYREQEHVRYKNPHKAFTFKVHGYEAVVGPVKGVFGKESGINKAREHSLLISDRPPFVTILSLVRDSAARLPNGEGTRADICELLKDSQYLAPSSDQQIHTVVSGALDRLHYEKDPCVKYDVNRKLWIYLHRNRTEEEFERIHQAQAAAAKARKAVQKNKTLKPGSPKPSNVSQSRHSVRNVSVTNQSINVTPVLGLEKSEIVQTSIPLSSAISQIAVSEDNAFATLSSNMPQIQDGLTSRPASQNSYQLLSSPKKVSASLNSVELGNATSLEGSDQAASSSSKSSPVCSASNIDLKSSSQSFDGQPSMLQSTSNQQDLESPAPFHNMSTGSSSLIPLETNNMSMNNSTCLPCLQNAKNITSFQTIVIKQESGIRTMNTVSALPLLSVKDIPSPTNSSSLSTGSVLARLVHGSQYLSLGNIVANPTVQAPLKSAPGSVQNFKIHGSNVCEQMLSTSSINLVSSASVSSAIDTSNPKSEVKSEPSDSPSSTIDSFRLPGLPLRTASDALASPSESAPKASASNTEQKYSGNIHPIVLASKEGLKTLPPAYLMTNPITTAAIKSARSIQTGSSLNVRALHGVKVIPVPQPIPGKKSIPNQAMIARIFAPTAGMSLRSTNAVDGIQSTQTKSSSSVNIVRTLQSAIMKSGQEPSNSQPFIIQVQAPRLPEEQQPLEKQTS